MLEIAFLILFSRRISSILKAKGRKPAWYIVMAIVFWFGGEFAGMIISSLVIMIATGAAEPNTLVIYAGALVGAVCGAAIAFAIVKALPSNAAPVATVAPPASPAA